MRRPLNSFFALLATILLTSSVARADVPNQARLLAELHHVNELQQGAGEMAETKATSPEIRSFAAELARDAAHVDAQLQQLAQAEGITIGEFTPVTPQEKQDQQLEIDTAVRLYNLQGAAFDEAFLQAIVLTHHRMLQRLKETRPQFGTTRLGLFLDALVPTLEHHLVEAEALQRRR